jgi:hypothetical protein
MRILAGIVAGLVLAFVLLMAVELFSAVVHPFPEGFKGTEEEICKHVERYPQWVLAVAVPAWAVTALVSTWAARKIGGFYPTVIVGLLLLAGLVFNISKLPYPIWFKIANLVVIPAAIFAGSRWASPREAAGPGVAGQVTSPPT